MRRRWPWVAIGVVAVAGVLGFDAVRSGTAAVQGFRDARRLLIEGGALLGSGDVEGARVALSAAEEAAERADRSLHRPGISAVGWLPWFSTELDAARRGATATRLASQGGLALAAGADAAGWDGGTVPGFAPGGRIDAAALAAAQPYVLEAATLLVAASGELAPVDAATLNQQLGEVVTSARSEIVARARQAGAAATLLHVLPLLLGIDGERAYLLVTLTPSDPRGAGGYPGLFGILRTDGSRLSLGDIAPTSTIPEVEPVAAPDDITRMWGPFGSLTSFWNTTYTSDFPTAARLMEAIWREGGGEPVDGVIAGDTAFMAALLDVVGPVEAPGWPEIIDADNVERIVGADVYRTTDQLTSDAWQVAIGDALWTAVFTRVWAFEPMLTATADAVTNGNLQVWAQRPDEQEALETLGVAGEVALPGDAEPLVTFNGFTANRAGAFADVAVVTEADADRLRTTITIENTAPTGPPSILLGRSRADTGGGPIGTFGTDVNVYPPVGWRVTRIEVDKIPDVIATAREAGLDVVTTIAFVSPGETSVVTVVMERVT